jgi:putative transposase
MKLPERTELSLPTLTLAEAVNQRTSWNPETAICDQDLRNPRIKMILAVLRDVDAMPSTWLKGLHRWKETVAVKHGVSLGIIYKWQVKFKEGNIAALRHTKPNKDKSPAWSPEAKDFWISLCGKREHRRITRKDLYEILCIEAKRRGWKIGGYKSALWLFHKNWNPILDAFQRGGKRAADNIMRPVSRNSSDVAPFQIVCGDQHTGDTFVVDEESGEVFRPQVYIFQCVRTRIIYGCWVAGKNYNAQGIGLSLHTGMRCWGAFGSLFTDNGRPELSKYVMSILANMRGLGLEVGAHRTGIPGNPKGKGMLEGTWGVLEQMHTSGRRRPGHTKNLRDNTDTQDIDWREMRKLAQQGKLLTYREYVLDFISICDDYNNKKPHRGVLAEWSWLPKPKTATPRDCLQACYNNEGWRPRMISPEAVDLLFLSRDTRIVDKGRISVANEFYTHDKLLELHKKRVDIRYNSLTLDEVYIFQNDRFLCTALPMEYSSWVDRDLSRRKIIEKRECLKRFAEEYKKLSSIAPDFREYSRVPQAERCAALIGADRNRRALENKQFTKPVSQAELDAHIEKMERGLPLPQKSAKPIPERPQYFLDDTAHYFWVLDYLKAGGALEAEDNQWILDYELKMTPEARARWEFDKECISLGVLD